MGPIGTPRHSDEDGHEICWSLRQAKVADGPGARASGRVRAADDVAAAGDGEAFRRGRARDRRQVGSSVHRIDRPRARPAGGIGRHQQVASARGRDTQGRRRAGHVLDVLHTRDLGLGPRARAADRVCRHVHRCAAVDADAQRCRRAGHPPKLTWPRHVCRRPRAIGRVGRGADISERVVRDAERGRRTRHSDRVWLLARIDMNRGDAVLPDHELVDPARTSARSHRQALDSPPKPDRAPVLKSNTSTVFDASP